MSALLTNVKNGHKVGKKGCWDFNCWGATLYALGLEDNLNWVCRDEMEAFLHEETKPVLFTEQIKAGDILVLRGFDEEEFYDDVPEMVLLHTAVYIGNDKFWHKRGANESEFATIDQIKEVYHEWEEAQIRRLKK